MTFHGAREVDAYPVTYYRGPDAHTAYYSRNSGDTRRHVPIHLEAYIIACSSPFPACLVHVNYSQ